VNAENALLAIDELSEKATTPKPRRARAARRTRARARETDSSAAALQARRRLCRRPGPVDAWKKRNVELGNHAAAVELLEEEIQVAKTSVNAQVGW